MTTFTLTVATSADGFIARSIDEPPQVWASKEEQDLFFRDVEAADWAIMGRNTHLAADKPHRRRIIFSTTMSGWQRPAQLWLDPTSIQVDHLAEAVGYKHRLSSGLILGGTRVHDWFLAHEAIHKVHLTIEPIYFDVGLPIFTGGQKESPCNIFLSHGFKIEKHTEINAHGTQYYELVHERWMARE